METAISSPDTTEIPEVYEFDESLPFTMDEVEALLAACSAAEDVEPGGRGSAMRKQAILLLLLDTGMHLSQLCRLRVADFSYREGELAITKAGASHGYRVWLGQNTLQALVRHLVLRDLPGGEQPLIADADDKALRVKEIDTLFNQLGVLAGVKDADPHRFRRRFAREYLRQGGDVYSLQNILGCPNLRDVLWELELTDAAIAREHRKASPGNRLG